MLTIADDNSLSLLGYDGVANAHVDADGSPNVAFDTHYHVTIGEGGMINAHWELWMTGDGGSGHETVTDGNRVACPVEIERLAP